ncbi:MAG: hypothetical protein AAFQ82_11650, partial [Myxococcota bacterium]
ESCSASPTECAESLVRALEVPVCDMPSEFELDLDWAIKGGEGYPFAPKDGAMCLEPSVAARVFSERKDELGQCLANLESRYVGIPLTIWPAGKVLRAEMPSDFTEEERSCVERLVLALEFPPCHTSSELAVVVRNGEFHGYPVSRGTIDREMVMGAVNDRIDSVIHCFESGPGRRDEFGKIVVRWTIKGTRPTNVHFVTNPFDDKEFDRCIVKAIEPMHVEMYVLDQVMITYPFGYRRGESSEPTQP